MANLIYNGSSKDVYRFIFSDKLRLGPRLDDAGDVGKFDFTDFVHAVFRIVGKCFAIDDIAQK